MVASLSGSTDLRGLLLQLYFHFLRYRAEESYVLTITTMSGFCRILNIIFIC